MEEERYISMKDAADRLEVKRPSLYHYIKTLKIEKFRFPLDRQTYIKLSDFEKIRKLKNEAAERSGFSEEVT